MGIIKSVLDLDLYKLSMQFAVFQNFPNQKVRYQFRDRNGISYPDGFDVEVMKEIHLMENLALTKGEKNFLTETFSFLPPTYIDFLTGYRFDSNEVKVTLDENNKLVINIEGYWYRTILWETCLMSIISELYFKMTGQVVNINDPILQMNDLKKLDLMMAHNAYFSDFGSRRRYSYENQDRIIKLFKEHSNHVFVGTSNVYLAYINDIRCTGTMGHEWIMVHAALYGYKMANKMAMDNWINTYNSDLGTMLSDTYMTNIFLNSFDMKYSRLFDSVRQDSGSPFEFTDKMINHYKSLSIDPTSKTIIFSDGLNTKLATKIKEYCVGKIKCSFGIGTYITNDVGVQPLNIVIKISEVLVNNVWIKAVKLSDNQGKHSGDLKEIEVCKYTLNIN